jgi:hypothetical protein
VNLSANHLYSIEEHASDTTIADSPVENDLPVKDKLPGTEFLALMKVAKGGYLEEIITEKRSVSRMVAWITPKFK